MAGTAAEQYLPSEILALWNVLSEFHRASKAGMPTPKGMPFGRHYFTGVSHGRFDG